jgi:cysteine desulfurase
MRVYLDWNATTPPLPDVVSAMAEAMRSAWGNPSSVHEHGRAARHYVEDARMAVAELAGVDARDVVLTSGATEANNLAIAAAFADPAAHGKVLVTSRLEHPSVAKAAEALEAAGRARVKWLDVLPSGAVDLADLERALAQGDVRLVCMTAVSHETGAIQPARDAVHMAHTAGALAHVDCAQAFGRLEDTILEADTRCLAAHKLRGPKGIGALIARAGLTLVPVLRGGSQERGVRPGTVDAVACAGLAVAARHAKTAPARYARIAPLRDRLEAEALRSMQNARVAAGAAARAPHVACIAFPGWPSPELVAALDLEGVSASGGPACSAGTAEPSPGVAAILGSELARSAVRFSLGEETTASDVDLAARALERVLARGSTDLA